jgi:Zn-dependent metalloprotease
MMFSFLIIFILQQMVLSLKKNSGNLESFGPELPVKDALPDNLTPFYLDPFIDVESNAIKFADLLYPSDNFGIRVTDLTESPKVSHVYLIQTFNGIDIINALMDVHLTNTKIVSYSSTFFETSECPFRIESEDNVTAFRALNILKQYVANGSEISYQSIGDEEDANSKKKYMIVTEPTYSLIPVWDISLQNENGWFTAQISRKTGEIIAFTNHVVSFS